MRLACLLVPDLPLQALVAADPRLRGRPLAVVESQGSQPSTPGPARGSSQAQTPASEPLGASCKGKGPAARLIAVSAEARALGIRPGQGSGEAERQLPGLVVLARSEEHERHADQGLAEVARAHAPSLQGLAPGELLVDASGVTSLFGDEAGYGTTLVEALADRGLGIRVGIASSRSAAQAAARVAPRSDPSPVTVVVPGGDAAFLAGLPLAVLDPEPRLAGLLGDLGLHLCRDLERLSPRQIRERLGEPGLELAARARGRDPFPYAPTPEPRRHRLRIDPEAPLELRQQILAEVGAALAGLLPGLVSRGLSVSTMRVAFTHPDQGLTLHAFPLAQPTREAAPLLRLLSARLERDPPDRPVEAIELELEPEVPRTTQLSLFLPAGPSPLALARTVSRLEGLVGSERLGAPRLPVDPRPAAFDRDGFRPESARARLDPLPACSQVRGVRPPRRLRLAAGPEGPVSVGPEPGLGLGPGPARVTGRSGPWLLSGAWWSERPFDREYWELVLGDGRVLRVFRERPGERWWLDGMHD